MSDVMEIQTDPNNWTDNYEFVPPGNEEISREELEKRIADATAKAEKWEKENAVLREQADTSRALLQGIEKLNTNITAPRQQEQQSGNAQDEIDYEALNEGFFDKPAQAAERLLEAKMKKIHGSYQDSVLQLQLKISENNVKSHPVYGKVLDKYRDDVEKLVRATPKETLIGIDDPYMIAVKNIAGSHLEELIEMQNNTAQTPPEVKPPGDQTSAPFTEHSAVSPPGKQKKKVVMTEELKKLQKRAAVIGMPFNEYLKRMGY